MKIKYEKDIKDCSECELYGTLSDCDYTYACNIDCNKGDFDNYPCQLRPCPIEVKE